MARSDCLIRAQINGVIAPIADQRVTLVGATQVEATCQATGIQRATIGQRRVKSERDVLGRGKAQRSCLLWRQCCTTAAAIKYFHARYGQPRPTGVARHFQGIGASAAVDGAGRRVTARDVDGVVTVATAQAVAPGPVHQHIVAAHSEQGVITHTAHDLFVNGAAGNAVIAIPRVNVTRHAITNDHVRCRGTKQHTVDANAVVGEVTKFRCIATVIDVASHLDVRALSRREKLGACTPAQGRNNPTGFTLTVIERELELTYRTASTQIGKCECIACTVVIEGEISMTVTRVVGCGVDGDPQSRVGADVSGQLLLEIVNVSPIARIRTLCNRQ